MQVSLVYFGKRHAAGLTAPCKLLYTHVTPTATGVAGPLQTGSCMPALMRSTLYKAVKEVLATLSLTTDQAVRRHLHQRLTSGSPSAQGMHHCWGA